jgi:hypothetical protein
MPGSWPLLGGVGDDMVDGEEDEREEEVNVMEE